MLVREVMTRNVVTVTPETPIKELASIFRRHDISGTPVLERQRLVGIVSETDVVRKEEAPLEVTSRVGRLLGRGGAAQELLEAETTRDVMTAPAVVIEGWMSVAAAASQMVEHDVNRLPVVENGKLVGIVTRADLVSAFARSDAAIRRELVEEVLPSLEILPTDVVVNVDRGWVTLSGEVDNERDVRSLQHAARCVIGVIDVISRLRVREAI